MTRNLALWPWYRFLRSLLFWQAIWFLYIQAELSAAEAIAIYAIYDIATTVLEVPSGWFSDRWGRRPTLILSSAAALAAAAMQGAGGLFWWFALAQVLLGAHQAFASGTDSALLYETLAAEGREAEIERHEVVGWRAGFAGLALSALAGGALARIDLTWAYWATAAAFTALTAVTLALREPPRAARQEGELAALSQIGGALRKPLLLWLLALMMLMYGFSHVPFVFGQPFILSVLDGTAFADETPLVSGAVTAGMMSVSLAVSLVAPHLRRAIGLTAMLLAAFALQVALPGALALAAGPLAVLLLLVRMVPDALARPYLLARVQPLLPEAARATLLSVESLLARLLFAGSLWVAAASTTGIGLMPEADLRAVLGAYAVAGLVALLMLVLAARRVGPA
ncbi:MFS transporter [Jannaschia formosa]|uniref:MFS transporter n=1 Tax=Jannaschia formosa TaxID=2259592 RepID=UPI001FD78636|nr:MFS transporter [Jannaschia formosa]